MQNPGEQDGPVLILLGRFAHWIDGKLSIFTGHIAVDNGKIISVGPTRNINEIELNLNAATYNVMELGHKQFIMPGFVDCHLHAPQFPNLGFGLDKPLLEWLTSYTFPLEKKYKDVAFAESVYDAVIKRTLKHGTTTACYFGSLYLKSSVLLASIAKKHGQRALVGKVSMNAPNDAGYFNDIKTELAESEEFIKSIIDLKSDLIEPVVTPRFAPSCCEKTLLLLGDLAKKYNCRIQSHISETKNEILWVKSLFPRNASYADVYDKTNLLTNKCIMAHGVHLEDHEIELLVRRGVSIAHCPASNTRLLSGLCPVRKLLKSGLTVGLGTDVSGGDSASILDALRRCMDVSSHLHFNDNTEPISWDEALYLATMGGAKALSLDHKIGNFAIGKDFDALLIDPYCQGTAIDAYNRAEGIPPLDPKNEFEETRNLLQQFIYTGDDRNIVKVFVKGRVV